VDPVTLVVTALAAGTGVGLQGTASAAVMDAYAGLKAAVRKRLSGRPDGGLILALPAAVAVWSGWVGIGQMTGFGQVHPLPGIWGS
jgi:hypothetical protein